MNKVDGRAIQRDIKERLRVSIAHAEVRPHLKLVYVGDNPVIDTYVELKRRFGEDIGVNVDVDRLPEDSGRSRVIDLLQAYKGEDCGVVLQLPLPSHLDVDDIVSHIDPAQDVDVLSGEAFMRSLQGELPLPPVVGAVAEIFERYNVDIEGKNIVIVGRGRLVGKPLSLWFLSKKCQVTTLEKGDDLKTPIGNADIVISGAGSSGIITSDMVKDGSVLIDAGTSDVAGETRGDMDREVEKKASIYAPVPGGVGPITVAKLFENLLILKNIL